MTEEEIRTQLVWRFTTAQRPLGRWRFNMYVLWKRMAWNLVIMGAHFLKRAFDIVASFIALLLLTPLFLVIAALVKLDGGPVFLAQNRVGKHGREFKMFKFRSMVVNADAILKELLAQNQHADGVTFKMKDDPRITKVGRWLRKFSLDEFPQFANVLIGDMSLVGPRPCLPREVALYTLDQRRRLEVLPGVTCLWQIGGRAEIDFSGQVQLDIQYIESHNFWGDVKILLKTIPAVLFGKGAY
ncbi:MAG: Undecaprenyl-phosphate galactose phosphotransferase [Pedosphaera sp.]|nr:Undecaprenyl-phosphate galactose phosphotransferase [Pedosphaera sp.]